MRAAYRQLILFLKKITWIPPLAVRLVLGHVFIVAGWGKFQNLDKVTQFFTSINIPIPVISAPFVAAHELILGVFLLVGFCTSLASLPLIIIMAVAILTTQVDTMTSYRDLFISAEFLYILLLSWLTIRGGGYVTIDRLIFKRKEPVAEEA